MEEIGDLRRRHARKEYSSDVVFSVSGKIYAGGLKNISVGGAFVITHSVNQLDTGDLLTIRIPFTNGRKMIKRRGRVLWTNNEGFALEFY